MMKYREPMKLIKNDKNYYIQCFSKGIEIFIKIDAKESKRFLNGLSSAEIFLKPHYRTYFRELGEYEIKEIQIDYYGQLFDEGGERIKSKEFPTIRKEVK